MYIYIYTYTYMYIHIYVYLHVHMYTCIYTYIHTYMYPYMYAHLHSSTSQVLACTPLRQSSAHATVTHFTNIFSASILSSSFVMSCYISACTRQRLLHLTSDLASCTIHHARKCSTALHPREIVPVLRTRPRLDNIQHHSPGGERRGPLPVNQNIPAISRIMPCRFQQGEKRA